MIGALRAHRGRLAAIALALAGTLAAGATAPGATGTAREGTPAPPAVAATGTTAAPTPRLLGTPVPAPGPAPGLVPSAPPRSIALAEVGRRRWSRPTEVGAYPPAGEGGLFVVEQEGQVFAYAGGDDTRILDISGRVSRDGNEEGLLSLALDPAFASNGHVWLYFSATGVRRTVLARFSRVPGSLAIDPASQLTILEVAQPFSNHKGGAIRFGPDGMLYLGLGDGGSAGDPQGNGQRLSTLHGKVIRIDVRNASTAQPYAIPGDNPFVGQAGPRGEIWAYGLRNPWRMAFDQATGALWTGDVGQGEIEEVDVIRRGANYGWNVVEGDRCYRPSTGCDRTGFTPPVATYDHGGGRCSITGGVVYRGTRAPEIAGAYLYADLCSGEVWAVRADPPGTPVRIASVSNLTSFGLDAAGEVVVASFNQLLRRLVSP
ncbi:MAG: glucose sorbosone dehydrogenase [Dehalococcoidia bacterium]|nr:glucose sorbosone dehydrogenase [Dehalococcoidia bacterium]